MRMILVFLGIVALAILTNPAKPRAGELPKAGAEYAWAHGPLLVCFSAEPLIAALQPGVQGLPSECLTLTPPIQFVVTGGPFWTGEFQWEGAPIEVGVYAFQIDGNPVTLYTALTARP